MKFVSSSDPDTLITMQNGSIIIGIIGPGEQASQKDCELAFETGKIVASAHYIVLTGGRNCGVMEAALKGAKKAGGKTIGILPGGDTAGISRYVDIPIITGMGNARNIINVLTSKVVIAIGESPGTLSEIALALKEKKPVVALNPTKEANIMFNRHSANHFIRMDKFEKEEFLTLLNTLVHET